MHVKLNGYMFYMALPKLHAITSNLLFIITPLQALLVH
jgi:hypothetical protein